MPSNDLKALLAKPNPVPMTRWSTIGTLDPRQWTAVMGADWTQRDPAVTQALAALGRNGVPVYAIYKNGQPVQVLSEVLSVEEVRSALASL